MLSQKLALGRRNYCLVNYVDETGDLSFEIRVEIKQGRGETKGYGVVAPRPGW
jgi:hypothetical protein